MSKKKHYLSSEPIRKGIPHDIKKDLFYYFIQTSWPRLFLILLLLYLLSNIFFATLYMLVPNSITNGTNSFSDAFFFSVQTMSTIGYGTLAPNGIYSNLIVTFQAAYGLVGIAIVAGFVFAKISKPHAKILFSKQMIHSKFNGQYCLSFRIGNSRGNDIVEAKVNASALIDEKTTEGEHIRRVYDLKLKRHQTPFFKLTWNVYHPLDQESPLNGRDYNDGSLIAILVTVTGHDGTFSNTVYSRYNYLPEDIVKDKYFVDIMHEQDNGEMLIDYENFHELKT